MKARFSYLSGAVVAVAAVALTVPLTVRSGAAAQSTSTPAPAKGVAKGDARLIAGKQVFDKWCATCHSSAPSSPGTIALAAKYEGEMPGVLEDRTDLTPEVVSMFVRSGISIMAPFRKTEITDAQLGDLSAYLSAPIGKRNAMRPKAKPSGARK
ncbi:MAG: cytochrome c [Sphingobium sp.]|nr:cytochrome c [Sphingobium sp.]